MAISNGDLSTIEENKGAERLIIHHVHQPVTGRGRIEHPAVQLAIVCGGNRKHHVVEHGLLKLRAGNHLNARAGFAQKGNFAIGDLTGSDDQHRTIF